MQLRRKSRMSSEVSTSSLSDIMFFLMLFFIIISTLLNPSMIKISLPSSQSSQSIHKKEINLTVTREMNYFVNNAQVTYETLEPQLKKELSIHPEAIIMLRIDKGLSVQDLVNVLAIGNKLNTKMVLSTAKPK